MEYGYIHASQLGKDRDPAVRKKFSHFSQFLNFFQPLVLFTIFATIFPFTFKSNREP